MDTLANLLTRERRSERAALVAPAVDRELSYYDFCTTAWKTGNFLRHLGVGPGHRVAVGADRIPESVLTFLGAAQLGAETTFGVDPGDGDDGDDDSAGNSGDPRAVVVHHEREAAFDPPAGTKLAVYRGDPERATTVHWEEEVWSENPAFPPSDADAGSVALRGGDEDGETAAYTHGALLEASSAAVDELDVSAADEVVVSAPLTDPGAVVAVLAAVRAEATAVLDPESDGEDGIAVAGERVPAARLRPTAVDATD
ncbi:MAG: AMP-binding protein [Halolamina sp.]